MTIQIDGRETSIYSTNGQIKSFPYNFPIFKGDNGQKGLEVRFIDDLGSSVVDPSEFTVIQNTENTGGVVQFYTAPVSGKKIVIVGSTPIDQQLDITNYSRFNGESIETNFDKIIAIAQEFLSKLKEEIRQRINNDLDVKDFAEKKMAELQAWATSKLPELARDQFDLMLNDFKKEWNDALNTITQGIGIPAFAVYDSNGLNQQEINNNQQEINSKLIGHVDSIDNLIAVKNPKIGQVIYVKSIEKNYIYTPSTTEAENGVTVVGKWIMSTQDAYYASWFCGESSPSNTKQDQFMVGYAYATSKKRPFIVDDVIYVNSTRKQSGFYNQITYATVVLSNSILWFNQGGKLIQVGTDVAGYSILSCYGADNFYIHKPVLEGERHTATGNTGESGFGLAITGCSNGIIEHPMVSSCRGDNFYIGQEYYSNSSLTPIPKNIRINKMRSLDAYRNGLTLSAGEDIYIDAPLIRNVKGTAPEACIDIEPEEGLSLRSYLKNVIVNNATLISGNTVAVLHWINGSREVDVKFTGTTTISGCYYSLGCNGSATSWDDIFCKGSIHYENIIVDQRISKSFLGIFDISVPTREKGIPISIESLTVHTDTQVAGTALNFFFDSRYQYGGNFKVARFELVNHGLSVVLNMIRSTAGSVILENIKIPLPESTQIFHYSENGTYLVGANVSIGGYEKRTVANIATDKLLANTQLFTPTLDETGATYSRVVTIPEVGRKLKYTLDPSATNVGYGLQATTPFLEVARVECIDKGGFIQIDNTGALPMVSDIFRKWYLGAVIVNQ